MQRPSIELSTPGLEARADGPRVMMMLTGICEDGGAEMQVKHLAINLKRRGWNVSAASIRTPSSIPHEYLDAGIPVRSAGMDPGLRLPAGFANLRKLILEERPHIVHSHMTHAVLASRMIRMVAPVPVLIGTLHGLRMYNVDGTGWKMRELLHRFSGGLSDLTTVVCEAAARYYLETKTEKPSRLRVVVNGVDTESFRPDPQTRNRLRRELGITDEFVWLGVGRFFPVKDHITMLRAFEVHRQACPRSLLLLAGGGPLEASLRQFAKDRGLDSCVRWLGLRRDVPAVMNASDALVLSSIFEALPLVLLEAGACGLPCVSTDVGGNGEAIVEGVTGLLAPSGDFQRLGEAMTRIAALGPQDRSRMANAARTHVVAKYSLDRVVDQWERIYWELLEARKVI